jgi:hypothetical protein
MRWNAPGVVTAARSERLLGAGTAWPEADRLAAAAAVRAEDPAFLPGNDADREEDLALARLAATVALRRHARPADPVTADGPRRAGKDLRPVRLVVGSGGVFRAARGTGARSTLHAAVTDTAGGWKVPERASLVVDRAYVLAAAGLLAPDHAAAAARLLARMITEPALMGGS